MVRLSQEVKSKKRALRIAVIILLLQSNFYKHFQ
jgi:hypothetical protein